MDRIFGLYYNAVEEELPEHAPAVDVGRPVWTTTPARSAQTATKSDPCSSLPAARQNRSVAATGIGLGLAASCDVIVVGVSPMLCLDARDDRRMTEPPLPEPRYVTVLRASAAVRLPPDAFMQFSIHNEGDTYEMTFRTRYLQETNQNMPRELWVEVVGPGTDVNDAMARAQGQANVSVAVIALAMNVGIAPLLPEICFHMSGESDHHDFRQNFLLDETGLPRFARTLDTDAVLELFGALNTSTEAQRLFRATIYYELALRYFEPGQDVLAVAFLWMAMEALTPVALRRELARRELTREALAQEWNLEPRIVCNECETIVRPATDYLDAETRKRILFQGKSPIYKEVSEASNGFEHAKDEFPEIIASSKKHRDQLAVLTRQAIFDLAEASEECRAALLEEKLDVVVAASRVSKFLRCTLVGKAQDFSLPTEQYPRFQLASSVSSVITNADGSVKVSPIEELTKVLGPEVNVEDARFEMWGPAGLTITQQVSAEDAPEDPT